MSALAVVAFLAALVGLMWFEQTRTLRSALLLVTLAGAYFGAEYLPSPWPLLARLALLSVALVVVLRVPWLISSMPWDEVEYLNLVRGILDRLTRVSRQHPYVSDDDTRRLLLEEYRHAARLLLERPTPHPAWDPLRTIVLRRVSLIGDVYEGLLDPAEYPLELADREWTAIRQESTRVVARRSNFWR